jgi:GxxExxY protein
MNNTLLYKNESYAIIGACMEVHSTLGSGFLESVYQEALALEFDARGISYAKEEKLEIYYKNNLLSQYFIADFICYGKIIVELKAVKTLDTIHTAQVINYLNATDLELGLLVNFSESSLKYSRLISSH